MSHYVVTAGLDGENPAWEEAAGTKDDAIEAACEAYDLTESQAKRLRKSKWLRLDADLYGVGYIHLQACDCQEPWEHSDLATQADWIDST